MTEPVVLVPDMLCDARAWTTQLTVLSYERPVTIAPVLNGDRIDDIASAMMTALPSKFALCGHGMGGVVALEVFRRAPERVTRLALIGTNPLADTPQEAADREPRIIAAKSGRFDAYLTDDFLPRHVGAGSRRTQVWADAAEMGLSLGPDLYARQERAMQRRRDQQATVRRIAVPTLVMGGEEDAVVPAKRQSFLAEMIPYAQLRILDGCGHMVMLEDPEATTAALYDWMRQPLVLR